MHTEYIKFPLLPKILKYIVEVSQHIWTMKCVYTEATAN